jgi:hypothetical protein
MDMVWLLPLLLNITTAVPIGNATELLAGMITPPVVIEICLPASVSASV